MLAVWEGAYRLVGWRAYVFPAPSHVLDASLALLNVSAAFGDPVTAAAGWPRLGFTPPEVDWPEGFAPLGWVRASLDWVSGFELFAGVGISLVRLAVGFCVSIVFGCALGLAMWRLSWLDEFLGPLFLGLQTLPSVCWAPLAILTFGIGESAILFVLVMGSFFAIAISLRDGLRQIPPIYRRAGHMLGARRLTMYRYVLLPASMPALASSLRSGFSFAWRSLMGAEFVMIAVKLHGLGYLLDIGRNFADVAQVIAIMVVMVLIGMLADMLVFARVERRVHARFGLAGA